MTWTCEQIESRLSEYLDHLLGAAERHEFEAHAAGCARCTELVGRVGKLVGEMHHFEPLEVPPRLVNNILEQTLGKRAEKKGWRAWLGWLRLIAQPRFAYGAVTVFVTTIVLSQALGFQISKVTKADLTPANIYRAADRRAHLVYARSSKFFSDLRVVYEIQSRMRPEAEPQAAPEQQPAPNQRPGHSEGQPTRPRGLNRANNHNFTLLACMLDAVPVRSMR